ncbi:YncE family protein [Paenibacillus rhizoplanae]|uniref:YncE family protein n=1 Tax=Paenibacillus rhizoplanae TaxID=1917181 RepID=UPI0036131AC2
MNMNRTANRNRNTRSGLSYVYVSYVSINNNGYVAVIDPTTDQIIKRISAGYNPTAMCLSPSGDKLYVADGLANMVYVYSTDTFNLIGSVPVDNKPVAILVEPSGKKSLCSQLWKSLPDDLMPLLLVSLEIFIL